MKLRILRLQKFESAGAELDKYFCSYFLKNWIEELTICYWNFPTFGMIELFVSIQFVQFSKSFVAQITNMGFQTQMCNIFMFFQHPFWSKTFFTNITFMRLDMSIFKGPSMSLSKKNNHQIYCPDLPWLEIFINQIYQYFFLVKDSNNTFLVLKHGFFKKLLFLLVWTSDQMSISFIKIRFFCNQNIGETLTQCKKVSLQCFYYRTI